MPNKELNKNNQSNAKTNSADKNNQNPGPKGPQNSDIAQAGAKVAANAAFGPLGGKAVDLAAKTGLGKDLLNKTNDLPSIMPGNKNNQDNKNGPTGVSDPNSAQGKANKSALTKKGLPSLPMPFKKFGMGLSMLGGTGTGMGIGSKKKADEASAGDSSEPNEDGTEPNNDGTQPKKPVDNSPTEVSGTLKKLSKIFIPIFSLGGCGCFFYIIVTMIIVTTVMSPIFYINDLMSNIKSKVNEGFGTFIEKMGNMAKCGFMTNEDCEEKLEKNFYDELLDVKDKYSSKYSVQIDISLIAATLTWYDTENTLNDDVLEDYDFETGSSSSSDSSSYIDFKKSEKKINELASNMMDKKTITETSTNESGEEVTTTRTVYFIDTEKYKKYLEDTFIKKYYFNNDSSVDVQIKVDQAIRDIYERVEFYIFLMENESPGSTSNGRSYDCPQGITLVGKDGIPQVINFETYIAGVIQAENGGAHLEAQKAQAIAARTYALSRTNRCKVPIVNSTAAQVFMEPTNPVSIQAAAETAGMVLTINGEIFSTEYDSYFKNVGKDENGSGGFRCDEQFCYVNYYKKGIGSKSSWKVQEVKIDVSYRKRMAGGHGRGMSQLAADYMARNGSNYEAILKFFYADEAVISKSQGNFGDYFFPVDLKYKRITSKYGPRTYFINGKLVSDFHYGIDLAPPIRSNIYAFKDGVVTLNTYNGSYGNYTILGHGEKGSDGHYESYSLYAHQYQLANLKIGDIVLGGAPFGIVGSTGNSTGAHLHFEVFSYVNGSRTRIDPATLFKSLYE